MSQPRRKARRSCLICQKSHKTCGNERPCDQCIKRGIPLRCIDGHRKLPKYLCDSSTTGNSQRLFTPLVTSSLSPIYYSNLNATQSHQYSSQNQEQTRKYRKEIQSFHPIEQADSSRNRKDLLKDSDYPLEFVNPRLLQIQHSYVTQVGSFGEVSVGKDETSTLSGDLQSPSRMDIDLSQEKFTEKRFQGFHGNTCQKSPTTTGLNSQSNLCKGDPDRKLPDTSDNAAIMGFTIQSGWSSILLS